MTAPPDRSWTSAGSSSGDERGQLERLKKERNRYNNIKRFVGGSPEILVLLGVLFLAAEVISIVAFHAFSPYEPLPWVIVIGCVGAAYVLYIYKKEGTSKLPKISCPECDKPTEALIWCCRECGQVHEVPKPHKYLGPIIGEPCTNRKCKVAATHFICPHCSKEITLDATRPRTRAAFVPGSKRTVPPAGPLYGYPEEPL